MSDPIRIHVDVTNPGQFFACCGLLELAARARNGAEGRFHEGHFEITHDADSSLRDFIATIAEAGLEPTDPADETASPLHLGPPFNLTLDWWHDRAAGGDRLKVWAGSMRSFRIARAMQAALRSPEYQTEALMDRCGVVYDPSEPSKKVEPFYFDARRGGNAQSLDIGFAPDALQMTTAAFPAVEFLCLVGLQRARPTPAGQPRVFQYFTWEEPYPPSIIPAACCGFLNRSRARRYVFENAFRTDQRKHKAFLPATPAGGSL